MNPGTELAHARAWWVVDYRRQGSRDKFKTYPWKYDLQDGAATLRGLLTARGFEAHVRRVIVPARKPKAQRALV